MPKLKKKQSKNCKEKTEQVEKLLTKEEKLEEIKLFTHIKRNEYITLTTILILFEHKINI